MKSSRLLVAASLAALCMAGFAQADRDPAWVEQRVQQWQPTPQEKRWEQIGWARDIRDALRMAKESKRPVFLFTLDGKMDVGRC